MLVSAEAGSSLLCPGVTVLKPVQHTSDPPPRPTIAPRDTEADGDWHRGALLCWCFAGGLCGLLVSCYRPVRLTKQGPVKLSRGWISEMCI